MQQAIRKTLLLTFALGCFSALASAQTLYVGDLSFDEPTVGSVDQLDITNLVGNGLALDSGLNPVSATSFSIDVTSLVVDLAGGGSIDIPGSDFSSVDSAGDLDCNASACNLYGDDVTSATLTGTFSYSGLTGLDPGYSGINDAFSTTITPGCGTTYLEAGCDSALITATEVASTSGGGGTTGAPEPETWALLGVGVMGLLLAARKRLQNVNAASSVAA
jgi:hypothetical protein